MRDQLILDDKQEQWRRHHAKIQKRSKRPTPKQHTNQSKRWKIEKCVSKYTSKDTRYMTHKFANSSSSVINQEWRYRVLLEVYCVRTYESNQEVDNESVRKNTSEDTWYITHSIALGLGKHLSYQPGIQISRFIKGILCGTYQSNLRTPGMLLIVSH